MATAATDTNPASPAIQDTLQDAFQDLINSCRRGQNQNDQSPSTSRFLDVQRACEEVRDGFPFHSEKGRRLVIGELTKLNGNYVVKIIRNGLSCLSRLYYGDAQTFENEAINLVKLCCLQYSMQTGQNDGHLVASPANVIDWTVELCDELVRPPNENLPRQDVNPNKAGSCLVKYLSKFADLYKSITSIRMIVPVISGLLSSTVIEPFKPLFQALKPRIHFEGFDELIQQTEAIVKTEECLDMMNFSSIGIPKLAVLLDHWISLLKFPFVTNWFALKTAEHDFLVHDPTYAQSLPFSDEITYGESLINEVCDAIGFLNSSNSQFEITCDKARLQVFFDNSEVLLRHTVPCFQLIQSEVRAKLIEDIFLIIGIKQNRALLPEISEKDKEQCEFLLKSLQKILLSPEHFNFNALAQVENVKQAFALKGFNHMSSRREKQTASLNAITRALLTLPDKEQVLKVLQIWKRNFPNDASYSMLSEIFALIDVIIQTKAESLSNHMEQFVIFLLQIPNELFIALQIWRSLFECLIASLPNSCYGPEILNVIRIFIDLHFRNLEGNENENPLQDVFVQKVSEIHIFLLQSMKESPKSEKVKIEALRLGLELFEEVPYPEEYEFALNVILAVASDMETNRIKAYTLNLLQTARVHSTRIEYPIIRKLITLIDNSHSIRQNTEIFFLCLALLQRNRGNGVISAVNVCNNFLQLAGISVNTDNCIRFFTLAAEGRLDICHFIVNCLNFNHKIVYGDRMNEHVAFLLTIPDKTLSPNTSSCQLFFKVIHDCLQLKYTSIDVFELIVASTAGSIAVGTFDRILNETVLKVLLTLLHSRKLHNPGVIFNIYFYLMQTLRRASLGKSEDYTQLFATGLCMIVRLSMPLQQIKWLIQQFIAILNQERITDKQEVWNVMVHLFKMSNNESSDSVDIDPGNLKAHFKKLLKPSIVRNTAKIAPILRQKELHLSSESVTLDAVISLSDLLVERMPSTFANKTSADLFKFVVKREDQRRNLVISFILPVVEAVLKESASEEKFKTEINAIEEKLLGVPPPLVPVIAECMRQYYLIDVSEAKKINVFILQILECFKNWQLDLQDTCTIMIGNILNIPKQLVQAFLEAPNASAEIKSMTRIIDSVSKLDPLILNGKFLIKFGKELHGRLIELIQHDFLMLLLKTSLKVSDVCTVLAFYLHLKMEDLLLVLTLSRKADMKSENTKLCWLSKYDQHQVLTPGNMVYLVIAQLRRLRIPDSNLGEKSIEICSQLLTNSGLNRQVPCGCLGGTFFEEYIEFFVLVLNQSSSLSKIEHWLSFLPHHAVQCKSVILAACSWKGSSAERREEAVGRMIDGVSKALLKLLSSPGPRTPSCYATLAREIEVITLVVTKAEDEEIVYGLLDLISTSWHLTEACLAVVLPWSKEEGLIFIEKMKELYEKRKEEITLEQIDSEMVIPLEILPFAAKAYPNSAVKVVDIFTTFELGGGLEDPLSLGRIPVWYKQMTDAGYPSQVIESWCTSLVHAQNLCSSDVDAITNITPETTKLLNKESDEIGRCLFSVEAPRTWKSKPDTDDTNTEHRKNVESFKRCLFLARLLNELASIAGCFKTNPKVTQKVKDCTKALCSGFLNKESSSGNLYKIRYNQLKDLFVLLFGEEDGTAREQSMMQLMSQESLSRSLFILFRRLARTFASKPTVLAVTRGIIDVILNRMTEHSLQYQEVQRIISEKILSLEPNQDAIHKLQAAGYNQSTSITEDLWYSSSIQMPGYITMIASDNSLRLERSLRQLWIEWRAILLDNNISEIELNAKKVKTSELFKPSDSLERIESQLVHVKQATRSLTSDNWSSFRRRQLIRNERRLRTGIEEQKKQIKQTTASKMTKMVIVWENQLLETVKTCSEKIPGCYAQNGFHSEKPVICGLAVDNRILTLYKQDKGGDDGGSRTEMENVEVKLYPTGMFVFGNHYSIHPYDTEQMWAAFYKMLLDKNLVPKIFLTNVSPGFDWIKQFVEPESSPPRNISFQSCCNLIPQSEDYFDSNPNLDVHISHTGLAGFNKKELIILTPENAIQLKIPDVKPPNRNTVIRQNIDTVVLHIQENDRRLQEMHPDLHAKILDRLKFAIRNALVTSVDGGEPTEKSIASSIDMEKLLFGCQDGQQYSKEDYAAIILDAVRTVTGGLQGSNRYYDGCEHVEFLHP